MAIIIIIYINLYSHVLTIYKYLLSLIMPIGLYISRIKTIQNIEETFDHSCTNFHKQQPINR